MNKYRYDKGTNLELAMEKARYYKEMTPSKPIYIYKVYRLWYITDDTKEVTQERHKGEITEYFEVYQEMTIQSHL